REAGAAGRVGRAGAGALGPGITRRGGGGRARGPWLSGPLLRAAACARPSRCRSALPAAGPARCEGGRGPGRRRGPAGVGVQGRGGKGAAPPASQRSFLRAEAARSEAGLSLYLRWAEKRSPVCLTLPPDPPVWYVRCCSGQAAPDPGPGIRVRMQPQQLQPECSPWPWSHSPSKDCWETRLRIQTGKAQHAVGLQVTADEAAASPRTDEWSPCSRFKSVAQTAVGTGQPLTLARHRMAPTGLPHLPAWTLASPPRPAESRASVLGVADLCQPECWDVGRGGQTDSSLSGTEKK
ncbi:PREDICTED: uncharacterized protein LOC102025805, partial [Chinchilla lanigera]|uniref:uncharacterized protein LOC102025805 n=1 Tax=Chinchilla lanigera TaxID=34839 RepID=UPI000696908F